MRHKVPKNKTLIEEEDGTSSKCLEMHSKTLPVLKKCANILF